MKIVPLADWNSVDGSLRALGMIITDMERIQAEYAQNAARLKAEYNAKIEPLNEQQATIEKQVETFMKAHKADLVGKSLALNFGTVGFRRTPTKIKFIWQEENIIKALRVRKFMDCVRVHEEPNKEALDLLDDDVLEGVGCRRTGGKDKFYAEPDLEKIKKIPGNG